MIHLVIHSITIIIYTATKAVGQTITKFNVNLIWVRKHN
jgi:hypothetical protein